MIDESKLDTGDKYNCKYDFESNTSSTTEMTGLIYAAPQSDTEVKHYNEVYPFLPKVSGKPEWKHLNPRS